MKQPSQRPRLPVLAAGLALSLAAACSSGGGGSTSNPGSTADEPPIGTILSSAAVTPTLGGLLSVKSEDSELDGVSLDVPPGSVSQALTLNVGPPDDLPAAAPFGQTPVGNAFVLEPTGTQFGRPATLSLPIPGGHAKDNLHVGRWDPATASWEKLGGEVDGDFISVDIDHLSLYAIFDSGRSFVCVQNAVSAQDASEGIGLTYISGPAPPAGADPKQAFVAGAPLPGGVQTIEPNRQTCMMLLPGTYHFAVSYTNPLPDVANSLFFTIPELEEGADDADLDQTLTIDLEGATSTDPFTDASIQFAGASQVPGSNLGPRVEIFAVPPPGVPFSDGATGGPVTDATRVIRVGPIFVGELGPFDELELIGQGIDPEGSDMQYSWTWSWGTLPTHEFVGSGFTSTKTFRPNPYVEGTYTVYFTAYDDFELFAEGRWEIEVRGNEKPTIEVIPDDFIIENGRLDATRDQFMSVVPFALPPVGPLCAYVDTDTDGIGDTTFLRTFEVLPTLVDPQQDPRGATCVFAMVRDPEGDPLTGGFKMPDPLFGRGTLYAALAVPPDLSADFTGAIPAGQFLRTKPMLDRYNDYILGLANAGLLPPDPVIFPDQPAGTQALPVVWEAPDCPTGTFCGGTVNIGAGVSDGYNREQRAWGTVGFPDDIICQIKSVSPNPPDPGPGQGVNVKAVVFPERAGELVDFLIVGSDGYSKSETNETDASGCAYFFIPGGAEGVSDVVTVECGESRVEVTYSF